MSAIITKTYQNIYKYCMLHSGKKEVELHKNS